MKSLFTTALCLSFLGVFTSNAQCIKSFPYTYGFENFTSLQTDNSCDTKVLGDTADGWTQDQDDYGEWRADTAGTETVGTGPGSTISSSGEGTGVDFNIGKSDGVYLYAEASGCKIVNYRIALTSPCFALPASKKYRMRFAYHMNGSDMGELQIDVFDGKNWEQKVWSISGDQGENWHQGYVNLEKYSNSEIQIKIVFNTGKGERSDCAIDQFVIEEIPQYDLAITHIEMDKFAYSQIPFIQAKGSLKKEVRFSLKNVGTDTVSPIRIIGSGFGWKDSVSLKNLAPFNLANNRFSFTPESPTDTIIKLTSSISQKDGYSTNNDVEMNIHVLNDSVLARDYGHPSGYLNTSVATGLEIGQMFEVLSSDTLTSISFYLGSPVVGDSMKVNLYPYGTKPGTFITSTETYVFTSKDAKWRTVQFTCSEPLQAGKYLVAYEHLTSDDLTIAYDGNTLNANTTFWRLGGSWTDFTSSQYEGALHIRMNFGKDKLPNVTVAIADSLCQNERITVKASGASTYVWSPTGTVLSKTGSSVDIIPDTSFTLRVTGNDKCGHTNVFVKDIIVKKSPNLRVSSDTSICHKDSVELNAYTQSNYVWAKGPSNSSYRVSPSQTATYRVTADSIGCKTTESTSINVVHVVPVVNNDTTVCANQKLQLNARGGTTYQWANGAGTATYTVHPKTTTVYIVKVTDDKGCSEIDSVRVTVIPGPSLTVSNDTAICFGQPVTLHAKGAINYEWIKGPSTSSYTFKPIFSKEHIIEGWSSNGCSSLDTVLVTVSSIPSVELRSDTTICEGTKIQLNPIAYDTLIFNWNTGQKIKNIEISPNQTTAYRVEVSNATGCMKMDSVVIGVNPLPVIDFSITQDHKKLTFINSSKHVDSYLWRFGDGDSSTSENTVHNYIWQGTYNLSYVATNGCGSVDSTFDVMVENLGISDALRQSLAVYPNPASTVINVKINNHHSGYIQIDISDISGREVMSQYVSKPASNVTIQLPVNTLNPGIYLLNITTGNGHVTKRIRIQ